MTSTIYYKTPQALLQALAARLDKSTWEDIAVSTLPLKVGYTLKSGKRVVRLFVDLGSLGTMEKFKEPSFRTQLLQGLKKGDTLQGMVFRKGSRGLSRFDREPVV